MDYTPFEVTDGEAMLEEKDGSWRFTLHVLKRSDSGILVCLTDKAQNGGSYNAQRALLLIRSESKGRLRADEKAVESKDCPHFAH
jgi:hypothetical protein